MGRHKEEIPLGGAFLAPRIASRSCRRRPHRKGLESLQRQDRLMDGSKGDRWCLVEKGLRLGPVFAYRGPQ